LHVADFLFQSYFRLDLDPKKTFLDNYIIPSMVANYCDKHVCLSVCLSAHISQKPHFKTLHIFSECYLLLSHPLVVV